MLPLASLPQRALHIEAKKNIDKFEKLLKSKDRKFIHTLAKAVGVSADEFTMRNLFESEAGDWPKGTPYAVLLELERCYAGFALQLPIDPFLPINIYEHCELIAMSLRYLSDSFDPRFYKSIVQRTLIDLNGALNKIYSADIEEEERNWLLRVITSTREAVADFKVKI